MKFDTEFLKASELAKIFEFGETPDPLLLSIIQVAGKIKLKQRKDHAYLVQSGKIVLTVTPALYKRTNHAMQLVFKEYSDGTVGNSRKNAVEEGILSGVLEEIPKGIAEECPNAERVESNELLIEQIVNQYIHDEMNDNVQEVTICTLNIEMLRKMNDTLIPEFYETLLKDTINRETGLISSETIEEIRVVKIHNTKIAEIVCNNIQDLLIEEVLEMGKRIYSRTAEQLEREKEIQKYSSVKAMHLLEKQLAENIVRLYIEDMITELQIKDLIEERINDYLTQREEKAANEQEKMRISQNKLNIEQEKLIGVLYDVFIEEILSSTYFSNISLSALSFERDSKQRRKTMLYRIEAQDDEQIVNIQDPEDFAMEAFTPKVHSPMLYSPLDSLIDDA